MAISVVFITIVRVTEIHILDNPMEWPIGAIPDEDHPLVLRMKGLYNMWGYMTSITTFVLIFFLSQAYALWKDIYWRGRIIQGRMNDASIC